MTKIIKNTDGSVFLEIDDGNPSKKTIIDDAELPYTKFDSEISMWKKVSKSLSEMSSQFIFRREYKDFYENLLELRQYAEANATLNIRRLKICYKNFFEEELEKHNG